MTIIHRRLIIKGRVQGVFFRQTAAHLARQLDLKGWVQNQPSGTVCIEIQGPAKKVQQFINWCHQGPPAARVSQVEIKNGTSKNFQRFTIKPTPKASG